MTAKSEALVVGLDPGTTTGIACLNLDGEIVDVESHRTFSKADVIKHILSVGTPVIVATDRKFAPKKVEKIAAAFPAKLFHPDVWISRKEKAETIRHLDLDWKNQHEKDAAAAALFAYKRYKPTLEKVKRKLERIGKHEMRSMVTTEVILNNSNIDSVLKAMR